MKSRCRHGTDCRQELYALLTRRRAFGTGAGQESELKNKQPARTGVGGVRVRVGMGVGTRATGLRARGVCGRRLIYLPQRAVGFMNYSGAHVRSGI